MNRPPFTSSPPSQPSPYRYLGRGGSERPVKLQLIIALVAGLILVAVPLYLWRRPRPEPIPSADAAVAADAGAPRPRDGLRGRALPHHPRERELRAGIQVPVHRELRPRDRLPPEEDGA